MNERIQKLAEQCRGNPMTSEFEPLFDKAKFAELIIRECAEVADMNAVEAMGLYGKVLEHFGVEV